jgi:hypothetical protein
MKAAWKTLVASTLVAMALPVLAQTYPDRPIRIYHGFAAGGGADLLLRALLPQLSENLGQKVRSAPLRRIPSYCEFATHMSIREIGGRTDHRHPHVRPNADGDHVLCHLSARSHASVKALGDDVGETVVDRNFNIDVRVLRQELAQGGQHDGIDRMLVRRNTNGPGRFLPKLA